jgi:3-dehydroquinate dehydratase/shikimate dehydrogenase
MLFASMSVLELPETEGIELRCDRLKEFDLGQIRDYIARANRPTILSFRRENNPLSEAERLETLQKLAALKPTYIDLEEDVDIPVPPNVKVIRSYHNFEKTPEDLDALLADLEKRPADIYKIATMARNGVDALRMVNFVRAMKQKGKQIIGVAMGADGELSRVLGNVYGNFLSFAAPSDEASVAPGQLSITTLRERYRYHRLSDRSQLYGLIGDPISGSIAHITHNDYLKSQNIDAVYLKMRVPEELLSQFFEEIKSLPFQGLSVTMPLKEAVLPHLTSVDEKGRAIGAVNTLVRKKEGWHGANTDAPGALNAIEKHLVVRGKKMVILGTGATASAIAHEAVERGAVVTIVSRTLAKAENVSKRLGCEAADYSKIPFHDLLINATPAGMAEISALPIPSSQIIPGSFVMDVVSVPRETPLLRAAAEKGCQLIYGIEMFHAQAALQFALWNLKEKGKMNHRDTGDSEEEGREEFHQRRARSRGAENAEEKRKKLC